jgi:hypothetical protein
VNKNIPKYKESEEALLESGDIQWVVGCFGGGIFDVRLNNEAYFYRISKIGHGI